MVKRVNEVVSGIRRVETRVRVLETQNASISKDSRALVR